MALAHQESEQKADREIPTIRRRGRKCRDGAVLRVTGHEDTVTGVLFHRQVLCETTV
jgi:hypothetical protein